MQKKDFYLGLDIGTDSVGYAVTDEKYNLIKFHGEPAWGSTLFDAAALSAETRAFRSGRRRLDRRQQRVTFVQELFAEEIAKVDSAFFIRLQASALFREDAGAEYTLFNDADFTDKEYYDKYPTIHHLIKDLMENDAPHDIRLVYLACAWLVAHRGHFLSNIDVKHLDQIKRFENVYTAFLAFFTEIGKEMPWDNCDVDALGDLLKAKKNITTKTKELIQLLFNGKKPSKEITDDFPYSREAIVKLLAGGTCKLKDLFGKEEYEEFGAVSLGFDEEKFGEIMSNIGEDYDFIANLRSVYDWSILVDVLGNNNTISGAKVAVYDQHKKDLSVLKQLIRKYAPEKYNEVFREIGKDNYVAYSYHTNDGDTASLKKKNQEDFSKYLMGIVKGWNVESEDEVCYLDMLSRIELRSFLPKQKNTSNRVIPQQLYAYELLTILEKASEYYPFLNEADSDGLTTKEKVYSIFTFKIPYFVGPLNKNSSHAWLERSGEKIYPWNFTKVVDLDQSEMNFIQRMTNHCTYIPGEPVLPKDSLLYHQYTVLNEINNIRINKEKITVELKQDIYKDLFMHVKKVTRKKLMDYLICNGIIKKGEEDTVSGIDININSNLSSQIAFKKLLESGILTESDVEKIIERSSYSEDKLRLSRWIEKNYPQINEADRRYICHIKIKDFGRLSREFLCGLEGASKDTGEVMTIISALWNTNNNLMELLSDKFTFAEALKDRQQTYYQEHPTSLNDRLNEMYLSNSVKRSVYRTLAVVKDIEKAFGAPKKIFVEMTRGGTSDQRGKRTNSRKQQILDFYKICKDEDVRILKQQLEEMGDYADNRLQGDKLFLYYMQLGKCMYTGAPIELEKLGTKLYDIDHIYPQAYVKDDSIINNKVLVLSVANGEKSDVYPIKSEIRHKMGGFWYMLKEKGLISEEKYKRLIRSTPFSAEEKYGFINRQIVETSQSTKAVAEILKEKYPNAEIVYCKARLTSEFRQEFDLYKSRTFNDMHHAVDAYLNIVTGNVYDMKFSKRWFKVDSNYSIKTKTLFTRPLICNGITVWDGEKMLQKVKKTAERNNAHVTKFAYFKHGGFFDQMPVPAAEGLVPLKKGMSTEKYGGYNKAGVMFYIPVQYKTGKKTEISIISVELLHGKHFMENYEFAKEYSIKRLKHITGKNVTDIAFPLGLRPWKVNTILSLDGYLVSITGISGGAKRLIAQPFTQFSENSYWKYYLKKLETFSDKVSVNAKYIYDEVYDKISVEKNLKLYDLYIYKYENTIFRKRITSEAILKILTAGRENFIKLSMYEQVETLLNIHRTFGRNSSNGVDLKTIGGGSNAGATNSFSIHTSNWKKKYKCVKIIDFSPSGLWQKESDNLLDIL